MAYRACVTPSAGGMSLYHAYFTADVKRQECLHTLKTHFLFCAGTIIVASRVRIW